VFGPGTGADASTNDGDFKGVEAAAGGAAGAPSPVETGGDGGSTALGGFGGSTGGSSGSGGSSGYGGTGGSSYGGSGGSGGYGGTGGSSYGGTGGSGGTGSACEIEAVDATCNACLQSTCYAPCAACSSNIECLYLLDCISTCPVGDDWCVEDCLYYYPDGYDDLAALIGDTTGCLALQCPTACD
jgi:hypothetical protein